jgi:hypothetical protein
LNYHKFRLELISYASSQCNEITGPTGLLAWTFSAAQWAAIPGNSVINAQGNVVVEAIFDIITAIDEPAGNAANAAVKIFELRRGDRNTIKRALQVLKTRCIHSMPTSDLSTLSDPQLGMMMVTNAEIFAHFEATHSVLNEDDVVLIFLRLSAPKQPTHDYATLAEIHRDLHALLAAAGQPMNEYTKTTYFTKALEDDPQGRKAAMIFVREHPLMAGRTFVALVATVILHAPTIVITTASLGYANASSVTTPASAAYAAPTDEAGMAQLIATTQKNLAALKKKNGTSAAPAPRPPAGPLQYCYKHGYTSTHSGSVCKFMKDNPALFQAPHLAAKDPLAVAGGNPRIGK